MSFMMWRGEGRAWSIRGEREAGRVLGWAQFWQTTPVCCVHRVALRWYGGEFEQKGAKETKTSFGTALVILQRVENSFARPVAKN